MNATAHMGTSRRSGLRAKDLAMLLELAPERWLGALVQLNHLPHYGHRLNVIVLAHDLAEIVTERDREQAAESSRIRFVAPIARFVKEDRVRVPSPE